MKFLLSVSMVVVLPFLNYAQPVLKTIDKLPDTGQVKDFTATFGEDSDYLIQVPAYLNHNDGTVTDKITGLMWQRTDGGEMTIENARNYTDTLTLASYSDWRLPTPLEAYSLMNHNNNNPALDRDFFPTTGAQYWWTSASQYNDSNKIWVTNAGGGIGNHASSETKSAGGTKNFHVRAVRNVQQPKTINERYNRNADLVKDELTSLEWFSETQNLLMTWEEAIQFAENAEVSGYSDWRLPNIKEMQSLNDETKGNPSCNTSVFSGILVSKYWSSTSLSNQQGSAWYWDTRFGITTYTDKNQRLNVILVRSSDAVNAVDEISEPLVLVHHPFTDFLTFQNQTYGLEFTLMDISGRKIYEGQDISGQNLSALPSGLYFLQIKGNRNLQTLKMIKQ
jgi:hypothetical protein